MLHWYCEPPTPELTEYVEYLYGRRDEAVYVPRREISMGDWKPELNYCHDNVTVWVNGNQTHNAVRGWLFFDMDGNLPFLRFAPHSVVRDEKGVLFDPTPSIGGKSYPFLTGECSEEQFRRWDKLLADTHGASFLDYGSST